VSAAPAIDAQTRAAINAAAWFERSTGSFKSFARLFWPEAVPSAPTPIWSWYLDAICDEVQAAFDEADRRRDRALEIMRTASSPREAEELVEAELGNLPRLWTVVEVGPRLGKSSLIQRLLPGWLWARNARTQILALAGTDRIVERDGIYLRELVGSSQVQGSPAVPAEARRERGAPAPLAPAPGPERQEQVRHVPWEALARATASPASSRARIAT
jgi:hypothetical protein